MPSTSLRLECRGDDRSRAATLQQETKPYVKRSRARRRRSLVLTYQLYLPGSPKETGPVGVCVCVCVLKVHPLQCWSHPQRPSQQPQSNV